MKLLDRVQALFFTLAMVSLFMGIVQNVLADEGIPFLIAGTPTQGPTLYCMTKDDAQVLAKALVEENEKVVAEKQTPGVCHFHITQFVPKKNVSAYGAEPTLYVHEVESGGGTFYLLTILRLAPKGTRSA